MPEINIKHLGKVFRALGGNVEHEQLPSEFTVLLQRLDEMSAHAVSTCPQCGEVGALEVARMAAVGRNLNERRCKQCGQIVLDLVERRAEVREQP